MARRQLSPGRRLVYYAGMALTVIGLLTFFSVFVTAVGSFGDFENFAGRVRSEGFRALAGMAIVAAGGVLMLVGRIGLAGSGVVLDPEQAREDVEPWSRMTGGVISDVLDEAGITLGGRSAEGQLPFDEKLRRLHKLCEDGLLSREEYEHEKQQLLDKN